MRKIFLWLSFMAALNFTLHSCIHDELNSSSDPASKEYNSKSLWKEDEVYITNVKEIFLKNANPENFKNNHGGLPAWDYAMTFGNFDESYLMVPVFGENKVTGVVTVERVEDKVYFKFSEDDKAKSFFNHLISSENKKITPVKEIEENAKIICSSRTYQLCFSNNDGSQDCYPQTVVKCISEEDLADNDMGGDNTGDGDGYDYFGDGQNGGSNTPVQPKDPCEKAKTSIAKANVVYKNSEVKTKMDDILRPKAIGPKEWALALGQNVNGGYQVTPAKEGDSTNSYVPTNLLSTPYIGDGHSHPGTPGVPSAGDLYGMLEEIIKPNSTFQVRFVYGMSNGVQEVYSLILNDRAAAIAFLTSYPRSENYDTVTHGFLEGSKLWKEIDKMAVIFKNKSTAINTTGEIYNSPAVGLAYMLERLNGGMSIAKVDANGNLKKINASIEPITVNGMKDERAKVSKCP